MSTSGPNKLGPYKTGFANSIILGSCFTGSLRPTQSFRIELKLCGAFPQPSC